MELLILTILSIIILPSVTGESPDNCPPADPNCHPTCIVYTADHCRYCMCDQGLARGTSTSGSGYDSGFGKSTDAAWDRGFEGGDWSSKMSSDSSSWSNSGGGNSFSSSGFESGGRGETVKYVIVEKEPESSHSSTPYESGISPLNALPNPFPAGMPSPFSGSHMPSALLPGSNHIVDSHSYGENVIHVPLLAPGIPKYCVRCHILSCPGTCERIDEYGCRSCPCAPSRYQTMPVVKDCSNQEPVVLEPDCSATKLCIESCQDGYQLGDVGRDGCRSCTCIRRTPTTPKPTSNGCPATLSCMLKCQDGYILGDKQANGCPSCKCLAKGASANAQASSGNSNNNNDNNNNNNNNKNDNNKWGGANWNNNNGQSQNSGSTTGNGYGKGNGCSGAKTNYLTSSNGIGSGKCEPPMCFDGHMSVDQAMKIGAESAGGGGGCNEGNVGSGVMDGGGTAGGSNSFSTNGGGFGSGMGGGGMGSGGMGSGGMGNGGIGNGGIGMGSMGMGSGGSSASGSGMPSPFSVSMSGAGAGRGGMSMGGGGGGSGGGMPFSPFSSAMSGGPGKGMSPGMGGIMGGIGGMGGMGSAMGAENAVSSVAYNKDCVGAECSAKNRMQHKDCPDLIHCLVTCDGSYKLGELDDAGCQTCSCTK